MKVSARRSLVARLTGAMALGCVAILGACMSVPVPPDFHLVKTVPLDGPDRWDYLTVDPESHRVYVAHGTEVTVIDGQAGEVAGRIAGLGGTHGIALVPHLARGDVANDARATAFDLTTLTRVADIPTAAGADAALYDLASGRVFVANGKAGTLTAIDPAGNAVVGTIALDGKPEFAAVDGAGKLFVNIEDTSEIVRVDTARLTIDARWPIKDCEEPHGLSIDAANRRLFASCVNALLMVVDADSGQIVARLPIGKGSDATAFDPRRKLIFSSNGDGTLSIYGEAGADYYVDQGTVTTLPGARTMAVDAATGRVFLVTADIDPAAPSTPRPKFVPGTVKLLMMDPR
jgi:YVTN family beta-propeller protein